MGWWVVCLCRWVNEVVGGMCSCRWVNGVVGGMCSCRWVDEWVVRSLAGEWRLLSGSEEGWW